MPHVTLDIPEPLHSSAIGKALMGSLKEAELRALLSGRELPAITGATLTDGDTLIATHEQRPNTWGTMAGAARMAAALYLGDTADFLRAVYVFKGWLGDRTAHRGFQFGDLSFQADPAVPLGINPPGAMKGGVSVDGALPDDMRRGCSFRPAPCHTVYPWEQADDTWQPWLLNHAYGPWLRATTPSTPGKVMGFTDWTHAG